MSEVSTSEFYRDLGKRGRHLSHVSRKKNNAQKKEVELVARVVLNSKFTPHDSIKQILDTIGIDSSSGTMVKVVILSRIAMDAMNGDIRAARFLFDVAGWSNDAKEQKAKTKAIEKVANAEVATTQELPPLDINAIEIEANKLNIYPSKRIDSTQRIENAINEVDDDE